MYLKVNCEVWLVIFGTLFSLLLRLVTTLHPYSGQAKPPLYGDYEAQRHWMEVTTNLPIKDWYTHSENNDLLYWGLDYPPLTAYHMYLCGAISSFINVNFTKLHDSRGYESETHKLFMRYTVIVSDFLIYIPAVIFYFVSTRKLYLIEKNKSVSKTTKKLKKPISPSLSIILCLLYPGIILIDHGHFQYNSVSLGFAIYAITFILQRKNILASIFFCLALNYKQMELYHSLPFFIYLLSTNITKPGQNVLKGYVSLIKIGITVIATFVIIWIPFIFEKQTFLQLVNRLFPMARGVFEDKVSNFWCTLNIFVKLKTKFDNNEMMRICLLTTLTAITPSNADLFLRPNLKKFVLAVINTSLAFFLFSFQVHEKSILLVAIPVLLYFPQDPFVTFWFLCISVFSMVPLLIKDGLTVALFALQLFYVTAFRVSIEHDYRTSLNSSDGILEYYRSLLHMLLDIEYKKSTQLHVIKSTCKQIYKNKEALKVVFFHIILLCSLFGALFLTLVALIFEPPYNYQDLFPLIISVYSFIHFLGFLIYFNIQQFRIPQEFEDIKNVKVKMS